jgi:hypothetical protein
MLLSISFHQVVSALELPVDDELKTLLDILAFNDQFGQGKGSEQFMEHACDLLRIALDQKEPRAQCRTWVTRRVKALGFNSLIPEERDFHLIREFHYRLYNGDFDHLFRSKTGNRVPEVIEILTRIGATDTVAIVNEAMEPLGTPYPTAQSKRLKVCNRLSNSGGEWSEYETDLQELHHRYLDLEESCLDLAAEAVADAFRRRGMPTPPPEPPARRDET